MLAVEIVVNLLSSLDTICTQDIGYFACRVDVDPHLIACLDPRVGVFHDKVVSSCRRVCAPNPAKGSLVMLASKGWSCSLTRLYLKTLKARRERKRKG